MHRTNCKQFLPIITIPGYIWKVMNNKGIHEVILDNMITDLTLALDAAKKIPSDYKISDEELYKEAANSISMLTQLISASDLKDIIYADYLISKKFLDVNSYKNPLVETLKHIDPNKYGAVLAPDPTSTTGEIINEKDFISFLNLLIDNDTNKINNFIMSINTPCSQNELFEILTGENGIFIILNTGFNNYSLLSLDKQNVFKLQFLNVLYNKLYTTYSEHVANNSYGLLDKLHQLLMFTNRLRNV